MLSEAEIKELAELKEQVVPRRLELIRRVASQRTRAFVPVFDQLCDPHNMSAVLRSAEAMGLETVHVVEGDVPFAGSRPVARGAQRWMEIVTHPDAKTCVRALHEEGYTVLVAALGGQLGPQSLPDLRPVAVVFGNEHHGVSEAFRAVADGSYEVPMFGFVESLNVSVAAALTAFAALQGLARQRPAAEEDRLLLRYLRTSTMTRREKQIADGIRGNTGASDDVLPAARAGAGDAVSQDQKVLGASSVEG